MTSPASYAAATGIDAAYTGLQTTASNLANTESTAYNRYQAVNSTLLYQDVITGHGGTVGHDSLTIPLKQAGAGVRTAAILRDMHKGMPKATKNPLDVCINGSGYVQVELGGADGRYAYTRAGNLQLDETGVLRTATGYALSDNIVIDMSVYDSVLIDKSGRVFGVDPTQTGDARYQELGRITLWKFTNPQALEAMEDTLFMEGAESGTVSQGMPGEGGFGTIQQGYIEASNVSAPKELVNAVAIKQWSESCANVLRIAEEMAKTALHQIAQSA